MRLVSACYYDMFPFEHISLFNEFETTNDPEELKAGDVLLVWGGADIHPILYGKGRSSQSGAYAQPSKRDMIEWNLMQRAKELGLPIIGVCRGGQMLCALAGGILAQHVDNHHGYHKVKTAEGTKMMVNSIHHQMMVPTNTVHEMVAWTPTPRSNVYLDEDDSNILVEVEPEFIYFNEVKGFAIQWHPEMMGLEEDANKYVLSYIERKLACV